MEKVHTFLSNEEIEQITPSEEFNVNIGVMGHIDSGKTSICKVLTSIASTASLDKNPQSQERGITIDLGFSAFYTHIPGHLREKIEEKKKYVQYTLVDCPGHASLMKTIIASSKIIDMLLLVIDINKGIQVQTAECLILGELLGLKIIVVLNKCDMLGENREEKYKKKLAKLEKAFSKTKYSKTQSAIKFVPFSAVEAGGNIQYIRSLKLKGE